LAAPITTKDSEDGAHAAKGLRWGCSCMQGWRLSMEDAHFALGALSGDGWQETAAFGVMDGHGGKEVAMFCQHHLPLLIGRGSSSDTKAALVDAFHGIDDMLDSPPGPEESEEAGPRCGSAEWVGCTAVVCLVRRDVLVVGNAGDSRAVLSRRRRAMPLSTDHKPNLPEERERIQRAGGRVERQTLGDHVQYRVNGNLNLSRSIGDMEYKRVAHLPPNEQMICSTPDVVAVVRDPGDEFLLLACDGVWDVMSNQQAVDFVHERLPEYTRAGMALSGIVEEMLDYCVSPDLVETRGLGGDNMTAVLVVFEKGSHAPAVSVTTPHSPMLQERRADSANSTDVDSAVVHADGFCGCHPFHT